MESRNVTLTLQKAKEFYNSGNDALKEVALQAFTKEELEGTNFKSITNFKDVCNALSLDFSEETKIINNISNHSQHAAAIYMLDLVRKALNEGETPSLILGNVYYPWVRFYPLALLEKLFGIHNLTSDAEGEETLICEKSKVQRAYNTSREIVKVENPDSLMYSMHTQIMCVLESIFGSKCLLDEEPLSQKTSKKCDTENHISTNSQYK